MKKIISWIAVFTIIIVIGCFICLKTGIISFEKEVSSEEEVINEEVVPEEEISKEQLRRTSVKLYFVDEKNNIMEEKRELDVKTLLKDPYKSILEMLIDGPVDKKLKSLIPKDAKILDTEVVNGILIINFNADFGKTVDKNKENQKLMLNTIYKSMKEYREVNEIKLKIEGKEVNKLSEKGFDFSMGINEKLFK